MSNMKQYLLTRYAVVFGADYEPGTVLELDEQVAARLSSEHEGLLAPYLAPEPPRAPDAPAQDRMVRKASKRG
jgi:hypothetical protein